MLTSTNPGARICREQQPQKETVMAASARRRRSTGRSRSQRSMRWEKPRSRTAGGRTVVLAVVRTALALASPPSSLLNPPTFVGCRAEGLLPGSGLASARGRPARWAARRARRRRAQASASLGARWKQTMQASAIRLVTTTSRSAGTGGTALTCDREALRNQTNSRKLQAPRGGAQMAAMPSACLDAQAGTLLRT